MSLDQVIFDSVPPISPGVLTQLTSQLSMEAYFSNPVTASLIELMSSRLTQAI